MADTPISGLPAASSVTSGDLVPLVHSGTTYSATPLEIVNAVRRSAVVSSVVADGTVNRSITFSSAFPNTVGAITFGIANYSGADNAVIIPRIIGTPSLTGFTVVVSGGTSGSTVDLHYRADGT